MKILHPILIGLFSIALTSCEQLGVEVTTVKGNWKSEAINIPYETELIVSNDMWYVKFLQNDSLYAVDRCTWTLSNDTLNLYRQNIKGSGPMKCKIEQLTMETLTLRSIDNNSVWVFERQYLSNPVDYDDKFYEVLSLKKGFWWGVWQIALFAFRTIGVIWLLVAIYELGKFIIQWIRKMINK